MNFKLNMMNNLQSHVNRKFEMKSGLLNKFGSSGSFSFGVKPSASETVETSSYSTLDNFASDLLPGESVSDGSE
jgi:hypothetical protein